MKLSKCQNKGANVDNATIADTVVAGHAEYRATVESLDKEANTVKKESRRERVFRDCRICRPNRTRLEQSPIILRAE
jgi:hypothetical protein